MDYPTYGGSSPNALLAHSYIVSIDLPYFYLSTSAKEEVAESEAYWQNLWHYLSLILLDARKLRASAIFKFRDWNC